MARFGVQLGSILAIKMPLEIHAKFHILKSKRKVVNRDEETLTSGARGDGRREGSIWTAIMGPHIFTHSDIFQCNNVN